MRKCAAFPACVRITPIRIAAIPYAFENVRLTNRFGYSGINGSAVTPENS